MSDSGLTLNRAIFDEPPDTLGEDESHHGHLITAMGGVEGIEVARAFAVAGHRLLAEARRANETWEAAHPILFCYRHALELYLKAIVPPTSLNHGLEGLWLALQGSIRGHFPADQIAWLGARVREFHAVDPRSTVFRYHDARPQGIDPELWVDFNHLASQASRMFKAMEAIWLATMSGRLR